MKTLDRPRAKVGKSANHVPLRYKLDDFQVLLEDVIDCLRQEEYGDALLFEMLFRGKCVYDHTEKRWYVYDRHYWRLDRFKEVYGFVSGLLSSIYIRASAEVNLQIKRIGKGDDDESEKEEDETKQKRLRTLVKDLQTRANQLKMKSRMMNILEYATSMLPISSDQWDTLTMMLGTSEGVIDLRTGEKRDGKPSDYIRTIIPTIWQGLDALCPRFEQFLQEIFADRPENERSELIRFLQMALGYGITGTSLERIFLLLYGEEGQNGKDTLMQVLKKVMGDSVGPVSNDTIIASSRYQSPGSAKPHLVSLQGKRLAWASETVEGERFDIGQVKFLTGGGEISARALYGDEYTFFPSHLLLLLTNNKPHADANDRAFWTRVCPVVFNQRFVKNPQKTNEQLADVSLHQKLLEEASGILAWLVRGAMMWSEAGGLTIPESVIRERESYREQEDTLGNFVRECCVCAVTYKVMTSALYKVYATWSLDNGLKPMSNKAFPTKMGKTYQKSKSDGNWYYHGLGLKEDYPYHTEPSEQTEQTEHVFNVEQNGHSEHVPATLQTQPTEQMQPSLSYDEQVLLAIDKAKGMSHKNIMGLNGFTTVSYRHSLNTLVSVGYVHNGNGEIPTLTESGHEYVELVKASNPSNN